MLCQMDFCHELYSKWLAVVKVVCVSACVCVRVYVSACVRACVCVMTERGRERVKPVACRVPQFQLGGRDEKERKQGTCFPLSLSSAQLFFFM